MQKIVIFLSAVTRLDFQSIVIDVDCVNIKIARCLKFQKIFYLKKCSNKQWRYVVSFIRDLFKISDFSFNFFTYLQPICEKVKDKNTVFLCQKDALDCIDKNIKKILNCEKGILFFKGEKLLAIR